MEKAVFILKEEETLYKINYKRKFSKLLFLGLILVLVPSTLVKSANLKATIYSYPADPIPTIDGKISAGEWTVAGTPEETKLYDLSDQYNPHIVIYLRSVYSEEKVLYLAIEIPDTLVDGSDEFIIAFNSSDTPLALSAPTSGIAFDDDHDAKKLKIERNEYLDAFTSGSGFSLNDDVSVSGTNDGLGKCTNNVTHVIIEFEIPFDSGDSHGRDIAVNVGDDEEIFLYYRDGDNETTYSHWLVELVEYDYCRIHIGLPPAFTGIPFWIFATSLASIFIIASFIKKKKK